MPARRGRSGSRARSPSTGDQLSAQFLREVVLRRDAVPDFDRYPFSIPAIHNLGQLPLHPSVTFFVGENGTGKSTLLEGIAVAIGLNPEGGSRNFNFATRDSHSDLEEYLAVVRGIARPRDSYFLRAESLYNVTTEIDRLDDPELPGPRVLRSYGGRSLHEQSHGESFLSLILHRFGGAEVYLLDEPEAALSPVRQMSFLAAIHQLVQADSQFVIATHSPIILAYPNAWIYQFGDHPPRRTSYTETEHYLITREFLEHTDWMLEVLLADDPVLGREAL
jgi:predicted ATPase